MNKECPLIESQLFSQILQISNNLVPWHITLKNVQHKTIAEISCDKVALRDVAKSRLPVNFTTWRSYYRLKFQQNTSTWG